jgi:hypothetical protein
MTCQLGSLYQLLRGCLKVRDIIKTILGVILLIAMFCVGGFVFEGVLKIGFSWLEPYKPIFRVSLWFLFWLAAVCSTLCWDSDSKLFSFKSFKQNWFGRVVWAAIWTVMIYLAAVYGIGLQEGPWERV